MSRKISRAELTARIPHYVFSGYNIVDTIIEKALARPSPDIEICAWRSHTKTFCDIDILRAIWEERGKPSQRPTDFLVEAASEGTTLAVRSNPYYAAAWLYKPGNGVDPRSSPGSLATPIFRFWLRRDHNMPLIDTSMISDANESALYVGCHKDILSIEAEDYDQTLYPPLRNGEIKVLNECGVDSLHAAKLDNLLRVMRVVASGL